MKTDSLYIIEVQSSPEYDYMGEIDAVDSLQEKTSSLNSDIIDKFSIDKDAKRGLSVLVCIILVVVMALLFFKNIKLSSDSVDDDNPSNMGNDTIYGHTWEEEIQQLMSEGQYSEVVVLCYLHWLSTLNDDKLIRFSKAKTPGMFLNEVEEKAIADVVNATDVVANTRTLTTNYLRIRYGHKQATEELAKKMMELQSLPVVSRHSTVNNEEA